MKIPRINLGIFIGARGGKAVAYGFLFPFYFTNRDRVRFHDSVITKRKAPG